jgi:hypothetical protein
MFTVKGFGSALLLQRSSDCALHGIAHRGNSVSDTDVGGADFVKVIACRLCDAPDKNRTCARGLGSNEYLA